MLLSETTSPTPLGEHQDVPKPAQRYNLSRVSWGCPGFSSRTGMPRKLSSGRRVLQHDPLRRFRQPQSLRHDSYLKRKESLYSGLFNAICSLWAWAGFFLWWDKRRPWRLSPAQLTFQLRRWCWLQPANWRHIREPSRLVPNGLSMLWQSWCNRDLQWWGRSWRNTPVYEKCVSNMLERLNGVYAHFSCLSSICSGVEFWQDVWSFGLSKRIQRLDYQSAVNVTPCCL